VRAVLDPNILIAALLSRGGAPGQIVARWLAGEFELVVSESLLAELARALAYPKLRARISTDEAAEFLSTLAHAAIVATDPPTPAGRSADPDDDYLLALAETGRAVLVSGDRHLLDLADELPIQSARAFLEALERGSPGAPGSTR
jgi:putative PIN family toxin of toxin-antitoxin system